MHTFGRLFILLFCSWLGSAWSAELGPVFEGLDGKQHALSEYVAQPKCTVVGVWGLRCRYCHEEMPAREQMHRKRSADINVVGIAVDYPSMGYAKASEVREFVRKLRLSYPILLSDGEVVPKLGDGDFIGTPTTLIFNPQGQLVARQPGRVSNKVIEDYIAKSTLGSTRRAE